MYKNIFVFVLLIGLATILFGSLSFLNPDQQLSEIATRYAEKGPQEVGAQNLVAAVIVSYRGLDTLGEVTILFITASIVGFFLKVKLEDEGKPRMIRQTSEILTTSSRVITPIIFLFGIYVFMNGHLTPGGGFQGGAIIASGLVLMLLARPYMEINHRIISILESISGFSFIIIGLLGIFMAHGFLDNRIFDLGKFGTLISAGAIPLIYIFIGLKVGSELSGIVSKLQETQKEKI